MTREELEKINKEETEKEKEEEEGVPPEKKQVLFSFLFGFIVVLGSALPSRQPVLKT